MSRRGGLIVWTVNLLIQNSEKTMKKRVVLISFVIMFFSNDVLAWNAAGHEIVAQIAYDRLKPIAKERIDALTQLKSHNRYADDRFLRMATWPDWVKRKTKRYNAWHYIGLPLMSDGLAPVKPSRINVVWAIKNAIQVLKSKQAKPKTRAKYLSFLIHFVGDIHQPMHAITHYSQRFPPPQGDRGGNSVPIQSAFANNLHAFWDAGLGVLHSHRTGQYFRYYHVVQCANDWTREYPPRFFGSRYLIKSPQKWAQMSHVLAIKYAYTLPKSGVPTRQYKSQGQAIVKQQIVLAGYRLARILNQIFAS